MHRVQNTIGLPIIDSNSGRPIGKVRDMWIRPDWTMFGVLSAPPRWLLTAAKGILWDHIRSIGQDYVVVSNKREIQRAPDPKLYYGFSQGRVKLKDLSVVTKDGDRLGMVTDVYYEPNMGNKVIGFEISDGFISDIVEGRKWFRMPETIMLGEDVIVVPVHCAHDLEKIITLNDG